MTCKKNHIIQFRTEEASWITEKPQRNIPSLKKHLRTDGHHDVHLSAVDSPGLLDELHPLVAVRLLLRPQLQRFLSIVAKNDQEVVLR